MSKFLLSLLCLSAASVSCSHSNPFAAIGPRSDTTLADFLLSRQTQMQRADPVQASQCFAIYLPLMQQVSNQWAIDYQKCADEAKDNTTALLKLMKHEQDVISADANGVCGVIQGCQAINETLDFFNCFAELGQNVFSTIYAISNNASDAASTLVQELNLIDVEFYRCTNASERVYVQNTGRLYDALDHCLVNGPPEIVTPRPTTAETTTTTTPSPTNPVSAEFIVTEQPDDNATEASFRSQLLALLQQYRNELPSNAAQQ